ARGAAGAPTVREPVRGIRGEGPVRRAYRRNRGGEAVRAGRDDDMSTLTTRDVEHIFEALRKGLVPERGIDAFAVGIEKQRGELDRQFELAESGEGTIKFLRGGYGCGKTF